MTERGASASAEINTVVVGASAAGLATAACLQRVGVDCVLLEQSAQIAPLWRGHYDRLHLHTSRGLSGLPYRGFSRQLPRYPSRDQVVAYLEDYAAHFSLAPRFSQRVVSISRPDDGPDGRDDRDDDDVWITRTQDRSYRSRNVVMATGASHTPHRPQWPGLASFGGPVLHSAEYRNGAAWAGRRVLVVGIGNSGAEIALDLCEHGARTSIAVRSAVNIVPRDFLGLPVVAWSIALNRFPAAVGDAVAWLVGRLRYGGLECLGLRKLPYGPTAQFRQWGRVPIIDVGTIARIRRREIALLPDVASFSPGQVHCQDGGQHRFDAVVLATGYRPALHPVLGAALAAGGVAGDVLDSDGRPRTSGVAVLPGLYLCGFRVTATGMLREIAREAKLIARAIGRDSGPHRVWAAPAAAPARDQPVRPEAAP